MGQAARLPGFRILFGWVANILFPGPYEVLGYNYIYIPLYVKNAGVTSSIILRKVREKGSPSVKYMAPKLAAKPLSPTYLSDLLKQ